MLFLVVVHINTHFEHMNLNSTSRVKMFSFSGGLKIDFEKKCTCKELQNPQQGKNNSTF